MAAGGAQAPPLASRVVLSLSPWLSPAPGFFSVCPFVTGLPAVMAGWSRAPPRSREAAPHGAVPRYNRGFDAIHAHRENEMNTRPQATQWRTGRGKALARSAATVWALGLALWLPATVQAGAEVGVRERLGLGTVAAGLVAAMPFSALDEVRAIATAQAQLKPITKPSTKLTAKATTKAKAKTKVKRTSASKSVAAAPPERTASGETVANRERRLTRECKGRPNAGACLGYAN